MTTGYQKAGTDLDALFAARVSAAAANVNFKSNGGVDLSQRFEPRGSSTAIANTSFKTTGGTDLSQVFKGIGITPSSHSLTAGSYFDSTPAVTNFGFALAAVIGTGSSAFGSISPSTVGANTVVGLWSDDNGDTHLVLQAASTPADTDTSWQSVDITGTFQGSVTATRTLTRTANTGQTTTGTRRRWNFVGTDIGFASGNIYTLVFNRV